MVFHLRDSALTRFVPPCDSMRSGKFFAHESQWGHSYILILFDFLTLAFQEDKITLAGLNL
jgi:hypothetical protein